MSHKLIKTSIFIGIKPGHVIETVPKLYNTWTLKLSIILRGTNVADTNILHATRYFDSHVKGFLKIDFMAGTTRLRICSPAIALGRSNCVRFFQPFGIGKMVTITLQRTRSPNGGYDLVITADRPFPFKMKFNDPVSRELDDVNVYVSDYWMTAANAELEAYEFQTAPPAGRYK